MNFWLRPCKEHMPADIIRKLREKKRREKSMQIKHIVA